MTFNRRVFLSFLSIPFAMRLRGLLSAKVAPKYVICTQCGTLYFEHTSKGFKTCAECEGKWVLHADLQKMSRSVLSAKYPHLAEHPPCPFVGAQPWEEDEIKPKLVSSSGNYFTKQDKLWIEEENYNRRWKPGMPMFQHERVEPVESIFKSDNISREKWWESVVECDPDLLNTYKDADAFFKWQDATREIDRINSLAYLDELKRQISLG